jgi:general secretion pathway protein I
MIQPDGPTSTLRHCWRHGAEKPRRFIGASRSDGIIAVIPAGSRGRGIIGARSVRSRERGFTLLEVIIAFAVLALALTLLLGTLSGSTREVRASADAGRAAMHAQSLLDQVGVGEALRPGDRDGEFEGGRYRWHLSIDPYVDPTRRARDTIEPGAPRLMLLELRVEWGDGGPRQRLDLQSLRLAQPEAL